MAQPARLGVDVKRKEEEMVALEVGGPTVPVTHMNMVLNAWKFDGLVTGERRVGNDCGRRMGGRGGVVEGQERGLTMSAS